MVMWPSRMASCTSGGSFNSLKKLATALRKWCFWFLGRVVNSDTKEPIAYCAYYEPANSIILKMEEGEEQKPKYLSVELGILMGTKLFSILLGGDNKLFEFENPTFINA